MDNQYNDITQLEQQFIQGKMGGFPEHIIVSGIDYVFRQHRSDVTWEQIVTNKTNKALTVYSMVMNKENQQRMLQQRNIEDRKVPDEILAFGWSVTNQMRVVPIGNAFTTRNRMNGGSSFFESTDISYEEPVSIDGLNNNQPFQSKIDTGADVCSLHATNIKTSGDRVTFELNGRNYTMNLHRTQEIKQADSQAQPRPVVILNFNIAGQTIPNIECNLNDRSGMSSPLLIGRNLLSKHDFNVKTMESVDDEIITEDQWDHFDEIFKDCVINEEDQWNSAHSLTNFVELMMSSPHSLRDLVEEAYRQGRIKGPGTSY